MINRDRIPYRLIRSRRKTLGLQVRDGALIVRASYKMPKGVIEAFISEKRTWIQKTLEKQEKAQKTAEEEALLSEEELKALFLRAAEELPALVREYEPLLQVRSRGIRVKLLRSRWGSCSEKGNLNFNVLLLLAPERERRYVVVHELCHLREMNHSQAFWKLVDSILPDYKASVRWFRENGPVLMKRAGF